MNIKLLITTLSILCCLTVYAQDTTIVKNGLTKSIFPVLFYLPETRLGYGVTGILAFDNYKNGDTQLSRVSQIQPSAAFTSNKQLLLFLPYELYFDKDRWKISGELGYFKYFYNFYGIGTDTKLSDKEQYDVDYPRFKINVLRRIKPTVSVGISYRFDDYKIQSIETEGILSAGTISGAQGGKLSMIGTVAQYDDRDDIFYPYEGSISQASINVSNNILGSSFDYTIIEFSYSRYFNLGRERIMAFDIRTASSYGDIPFYELFYFGSTQRSRGTPDRRYMDRNFFALQHEYRFPLWKRIGGVVFHSLSTVEERWPMLFSDARYIYAYGLGMRYKLTKEQRVRLRMDFGFSESQFNFYFTIGEAF